MPKPFFQRLSRYFDEMEGALAANAKSAEIFANPTDRGDSRELNYLDFLRQHTPANARVFKGGFLFGMDGSESRQIDVVVCSAGALRFDFHNPGGYGKSFACVDGSIAVASVKSKLDKKELEDSLRVFESIPEKQSIQGLHPSSFRIPEYEQFPYKIIFAHDSVKPQTVLTHLQNYYSVSTAPSASARPNIIHVAGKYSIVRTIDDTPTRDGTVIPANTFHLNPPLSTGWALLTVATTIQTFAYAAGLIAFPYESLANLIPLASSGS